MGERLKGRVAVVTGSGRGIGREIALLVASEGAAVVVNDLGCAVDGSGTEQSAADEVVGLIRKGGGKAAACYDSVADFAGAGRIVDTAVKEFGRIDILVNNAGILRDRMIFNMSEEEWDSVIGVHLKGSWNCTHHASGKMREQKGGRIISITSTSGLYGNPGQANYSAAKDGIAGLTRVVARELGKYGVTVNAISPAANTRMVATVPKNVTDLKAARGLSTTPRSRQMQGLGGPEDIAPMATYLATDAASEINGQIFLVFGGMIARMNDPAPARTIQKATRWTPEEIAMIFPRTFGMDLVNPAPAAVRTDGGA